MKVSTEIHINIQTGKNFLNLICFGKSVMSAKIFIDEKDLESKKMSCKCHKIIRSRGAYCFLSVILLSNGN